MNALFAVTLAALLLLGACANNRDVEPQKPMNEAAVTSGTGNTGRAGTATPGPGLNSQSRTEAAREAERR